MIWYYIGVSDERRSGNRLILCEYSEMGQSTVCANAVSVNMDPYMYACV